MVERWKLLPFNGNMEISSLGRLRNWVTGVIWKPQRTRGGYMQYAIWSMVTRKSKSYKVHRLVADAFLNPIPGKSHINHKDFDKTNNCIHNLEWCTREENIKHYYEYKFKGKINDGQVLYIRQNIDVIGVRRLAGEFNISEGYVMSVANGSYFPNIHKEYIRDKKPIVINKIKSYDMDGNFIYEYESMKKCARITGFRLSKIQEVVSGQRKSYKGFVFKCEGYKQKPKKQRSSRKKKTMRVLTPKIMVEPAENAG